MKRLTVVLITMFVFWSNVAVTKDIATPLKLIKALPVEGPSRNQPSGLTIFNSTLFTVSDKHDDTIFRVKLMEDKAVLVPHIKFKLKEPIPEKNLDIEGITCDEEGNFYLVSETAFRILRVSANGADVSWVTESLRSYGEEKGLFQTKGAYLEGITLVDKDQFVVCAERQPRGILFVDLSTTPQKVRAKKYDTTKANLPEGRHPDFAGLFSENKTLYVLQRNAYAISKLQTNGQEFEEKDFWNYEAIVTSEELQYENMRFGRAEGLCMDTNHVYIILDNNGDARLINPNDRRPLLLIMERPKS